MPKGRQCPAARIHLLQETYNEEAAQAFVASRPQEFRTLEEFKLESDHLAAKSARSLDELRGEADRLVADDIGTQAAGTFRGRAWCH